MGKATEFALNVAGGGGWYGHFGMNLTDRVVATERSAKATDCRWG
jgi:hypothetical protein